MIERILTVIVLIVVAYVVYRLYTQWQLTIARNGDPLLCNFQPGVPAIVYFSTPTCAPCRLQQTPTLQQLLDDLGEQQVQVIKVDATEQPEAADRWGVLSVPTTFVLDRNGKPRTVHNGVVDLKTLKRELQS